MKVVGAAPAGPPHDPTILSAAPAGPPHDPTMLSAAPGPTTPKIEENSGLSSVILWKGRV